MRAVMIHRRQIDPPRRLLVAYARLRAGAFAAFLPPANESHIVVHLHQGGIQPVEAVVDARAQLAMDLVEMLADRDGAALAFASEAPASISASQTSLTTMLMLSL